MYMPTLCQTRPQIVTMSPPCQPMSEIGRRLGALDHRTEVWPATLLLVQLLLPPLLIIENVCGITTAHKGEFVMALVARIRSYGYTVVEHRVDACSFLPVQRARWFLLALRADLIGPDTAHWMERRPTPAWAFGSQLCLWPNLSSAQTKAAERTPLGHHQHVLPPASWRRLLLRCRRSAPRRTGCSSWPRPGRWRRYRRDQPRAP